ncbi:YggT family protein [Synechococcus moorigangaii CMS01]|nr:YggT family protein [Synechococcus moorigangaii CMS01]
MNQYPNPNPQPDDDGSANELAKLRQEQQKVDAIRKRVLFRRLENSVYILVGLLEVLLALRFFLRLSGANPENTFAQFIYGLSEPFVSPFSTLFISPVERTEATLGDNILDLNLLIAIIIYGLLCFLATWIIRYVYRQVAPTDL